MLNAYFGIMKFHGILAQNHMLFYEFEYTHAEAERETQTEMEEKAIECRKYVR